jgi:hypothetical protein
LQNKAEVPSTPTQPLFLRGIFNCPVVCVVFLNFIKTTEKTQNEKTPYNNTGNNTQGRVLFATIYQRTHVSTFMP